MKSDPILVDIYYKEGGLWRIIQHSSVPWSSYSSGSNLEFRRHLIARCFMAANASGGDKGIIGEMIAHPKLTDGGMIKLAIQEKGVMDTVPDANLKAMSGSQKKDDKVVMTEDMGTSSSQGPAAFTEGEIDEEEEDIIEVSLEEEEVQIAGQWTILARFYSMRLPNHQALFDDMCRAWQLRADMSYKSLRENMFIITFSSEGDYKFVLQGGPWIHHGDALLVAEFDGITCPSKVPLESVPIWVRIYDLPLALMTKQRGELYGSRLGKVCEVDVGDDGRNMHDFFRIRVDLPVKRPLKEKIAIMILVQGKEEIRKFDLRYELVPHFCFICGYLGHSDKDYGRRVANEDQPFRFSAELRCSPMKPFERKVSKVKAFSSSGVARNLVFRGAGSASSSTSRQKQGEQWNEAVPPRVDARDNFEAEEMEGDDKIDEQLAQQAQHMQMEGEENRIVQGSAKEATPNSEMILAIANLHQQASFGEVSSDEFSAGNRKRVQEQTGGVKPGIVKQALLEYQQAVADDTTGQMDSRKLTRALKRSRRADGEQEVDNLEATSQGAAGKLTGSALGSRQEQ